MDAATGDLVRTGGSFRRLEAGPEEIAQYVRVRSRLFRGECFLRTDLGVEYLGGILAKGFTSEEIVGEYRSIVLETPGISAVGNPNDPANPGVRLEQTEAEKVARVARVSYTATYSVENLAERGPLQDTFTVAVV